MQTINIHDAKTQFSKLIESVLQGEEIVIAKAGKPAARLVPLSAKSLFVRKPGSMKGIITIADDFDAPLSDEIQAGFEGR
jgi:prevent-host-death family protein